MTKYTKGKDYHKESYGWECDLCCTDEFDTKQDVIEHLKEVHPNGEDYMKEIKA